MIGNCIIALIFSPILAEFFTFFDHDCRGFIRSDKTMTIFSVNMEPRVFRALLFCLIFLIIYPGLKWIVGLPFSWSIDIGGLVAYMCFLDLIEPLIIHLNGDEEAKTTLKEPYPDWFSTKTRWSIFGAIILIAACASPLLWSACFEEPLRKNPEVYKEFLSKIPKSVKHRALWFLCN